jgi:hypothetical protein
MKEIDKLRILIPHWIEHNAEHEDEFRRWAEKAGEYANNLRAAADSIAQANEQLQVALDNMGGPLPTPEM